MQESMLAGVGASRAAAAAAVAADGHPSIAQ